MAIDVQSEVEKIARLLFDNATKTAMRRETGFEQCDALMTRYLMIANHLINDLVTRAVAEAKSEQMEADCKAVTTAFSRNYEWSDCDRVDEIRDMIRTAFATTEPRDIVKDDARQRFNKAAVELARMTKCIEPSESMVVNNSPDPGCECPACVLMIAARELGLDGAA